MSVSKKTSLALLLAAPGVALSQAAAGGDSRDALLEPIVVVAPIGVTLERDRVPADSQRATSQRIDELQALDLTDFMNRAFGSVSINHAQNNPLQPDFNFRGFTASPLLGLPQGLAAYQNGVRINEPFGDTVNWDLIAASAVQEVQLLAGANPVFGLNTLGGALSVRMKDGFAYDQNAVEAQGGSFGRFGANAQSGGNNGTWGYYLNADYLEEDGWRDFSPTEALRLFGTVGYRSGDSTLDLSISHVDSDLFGNGASPVELLAQDRAAVFTHPDRTQNKLTQVILEGSTALTGGWQLAGNAHYRDIDTDSFNGDGSIFDECEIDDVEFLCEEGDDEDEPGEVVLDQNGNPIEAELDDEELNAINNISRRRQKVYGASVQASLESELAGGRLNNFSVGAAFSDGDSSFDSVVEVASLLQDRSTSRTGIFADEFRTAVDSTTRTWSVYFANALDLTDQLTLTLAGRHDDTSIRLRDRSGGNPELNGNHSFSRFNPAVGLTWRAGDSTAVYASWSQSTRAPTPVELACADEDAPCNLPNAFLADPPLEQVVANSFELGVTSARENGLEWHAGGFLTTNRNDILFQTTGGATANVGYFANVADTRRAGVELRVGQRIDRLRWSVNYSYIAATFEDDFIVNSPNHPVFGDDDDDDDAGGDSPAIVGPGKLAVANGSDIPGIPRHQLDAAIDYGFTDRLSLGVDALYRSGVYLRGDEANLLGRTSGYVVVNLRGEFRVTPALRLFARVENLFDEDYETFGLLGEPDEVFEDFEDPRFYGAGPPRGAWVGVRYTF